MKPFAATAALMMALSAWGLTGCALMVPTQGKPEISCQENAGFSDKALVSVGPRRLLEVLIERIVSNAPHLKPIDGLQFRDTAFPQGGWQLQGLLEHGNRTRIVQALQVDYLVLVSRLATTMGD